jgi:hypothetical protein
MSRKTVSTFTHLAIGLTWHLDLIARYRFVETITPDFLKSSSRGDPRVPRPLLLVKVTAAAAARRPSYQSSKIHLLARSR